MSDMPMMGRTTSALLAAVMMVAMMLPSLAAALWYYRRGLHTMRVPHPGARTMLFAAGYAGVWSTVGLLLFAMGTGSSSLGSQAPARATLVSLAAGAIVFCAGALQRSQWKARQLARCRRSCVPTLGSAQVTTAWRDGCRLGGDCALSCAAPMAILLVVGLMNAPMMVVVTAAITAERVASAGARIARLTGALALVVGAIMCATAIA